MPLTNGTITPSTAGNDKRHGADRHNHATAARGRCDRPCSRAGAVEELLFPAIAEAEEEHRIETMWGSRCFRRRRGEALHPEREPLETLDRIRGTIREYNFAGQYQQSPAPLGGGLVKAEWFKRYRENDRPERFDRIVQSWDTANKASELSDFSVCTTWGVKGKDLYLLAVFRRRLDTQRSNGASARVIALGRSIGGRAPPDMPPSIPVSAPVM